MLEIQRGHAANEETGGKDVHHVARYDVERPGPGPDKSIIDVVTGDGAIYRFSQLLPGESYRFEPGEGPHDDGRVGRSGRLPGVVDAVVDDAVGGEPGWFY